MRLLIAAAGLALLAPSMASAATWVAICSDGKNIQYNQTVGGNGFLYMKTSVGTYQTARLSQTFYNGTAICGAVVGNTAAGAPPITQVCANQARKIIYLKYQNPTVAGAPVQDAGTFCAANVSIK